MQILKAIPYFVDGYGFLYIFKCHEQGRSFSKISERFVREKFNGDPIEIYYDLQEVSPITNLNKSNKNAIIEKAKEYEDRKPKIPKPIEAPKEEPASPEQVNDIITKFRESLGKDKTAGNWYSLSKKFAQYINK